MAGFPSLSLLASLALVCLGQLEGVVAGCVDAMGADGPSIGNFHRKGRELSQCVREYRQKYHREFECRRGFQGRTCIQIKDHFQSFVDELRLCLGGRTTTAPTTTITTPPLPNPKDCKDLFDRGETGDRVATIFPDGETPVSVRCIDDATVILNRDSYSLGFNKTYAEYAEGFGPRNGDYYLGNDVLHTLTSAHTYKLRVDVERPNGTAQFAEYTIFTVDSAVNRYNLTVGGYSGDAGDALFLSNGKAFSTVDNADSIFTRSVAGIVGGGFWFPVFPTGVFTSVTGEPGSAYGVFAWGSTIKVEIVKARLSLERI